MLKCGTKSAFFGYIWARILKNYCHIWNQQPQVILFTKFREKTKAPKFRTKSAWFGYFGDRILKNYCHIWNQHPQHCQKWVLNSYSEFWHKVRFFWSSGSGSRSTLWSMPDKCRCECQELIDKGIVITDLFGILVIVNVSVIHYVMLQSI